MPRIESVLACAAGGISAILWLWSASPWLASDLRFFTLGVSIAWTLWCLMRSDAVLAVERAWSTSPEWILTIDDFAMAHISSWISTAMRLKLAQRWKPSGLLLGKAFTWNAGYTQRLEMVLARDGVLPIATGSCGGHPALHAVGSGKEKLFDIPWSELRGHVLCTGTTGSGKTRLLEVIASGAIAEEECTMIIDPKGDRELLARCAAEAQRSSRPFAIIAPAFPQQSAHIDVFGTATTPAEVSARIRALMPNAGARGSDPFYEEYPLALIERIASAQKTLGQPWTLEGLYKASVLPAHAEALLLQYLVYLGASAGRGIQQAINHYQTTIGGDLVADALITDFQHDRQHFEKVTANLIPAFRGVVGEPLGCLFSLDGTELTWDTIVEDKMVVYVALASMLLGDIANRIGRVLLQDFAGFLGRRYAYSATKDFTPITVIIDEFSDVAYPLFTNVLNKGGAAGARFILAQQSLADAEAAMGKAEARRVMDNLSTKIYLRLSDDTTALIATEGLGTCTVRLPETGVGLSYGGVGGLSGNSHRRFPGRETALIRPSWVTALPRGEAFVRCKGEIYKLRVPLLTPVPAETIRSTGLEALWNGLTP